MNNGLMTERAHLGVFSTASYISIGDNYGKKADSDPRLLGKQFSHFFPTSGIAGARPNNSMFDREHKWLYGGEKCAPHARPGRRPAADGTSLHAATRPVLVAAFAPSAERTLTRPRQVH